MSERVIIVGGGPGGLSAAIYLAAAGRAVTLLEQNAQVGGKMSEIRQDGYRWDTGPTVITLRHVFDDLFQSAGTRTQDYLDWVSVDPLTRYHYPDGQVLDINVGLAETLAQIERLDARDVDGYLRFLAYAAEMYRITAPTMLLGDPPTLRGTLSLPLRDVLRVDLRAMDTAIHAHVRTPYLRRLFDRFATYLGASPYQARAYLNVIAHVELTAGLYYPRGGTHGIALAYRRLAEALGVEVRTSACVRRILTEHDRAVGVELAGGEIERAQTVIANIDPTTVYSALLPEMQDSPRLRRWQSRPFACSGFVLYLGLDKTFSQLAHHNIFFSPDYRAEFEAMFRRGIPSAQPTVYVAITAKSDPNHAPAGGENWFVMANTPPIDPHWDWTREAAGYRECVLDRLAAYGLDVRGHIVAERQWTPLDIQEQTGAWRGSLYGHSFNHPLASFVRPHPCCPDVKGLYFTGGATHPGGGVPLAILSGKTTARLVLHDFNKGG